MLGRLALYAARRSLFAATLFASLLPSVLLFIGGLKPLQTASIVASLPLLLVYALLIVSIVRMLRMGPDGA